MTNLQKAAELKNLGNQAFKTGKYDEAIKFFSQAIECNPNDHVFYSNRSSAYLNAGQLPKALQDAEKCVQMNSSWPRGYQRKGTALFYLDKIDEAISTYEEGLKLDPNNAALKQDLESARKKKSQPPPQMNQAYLNGLMKLVQHPETKDFIQDPGFMQKVQMCMQNPQMLPVMMQQDPKIKKAFDVISSSQPSNFNFEDLMKNMGQSPPPQEPKTQFKPKQKKEEKKMDVEDPAEQFKNKGNLEFKHKNFQAALNLYEQAIKLKPDQPLYYNNKAAAYIELKNYDLALEQIAKAQKIFEDGIVKDFVKKAKVLARKASVYAKKNLIDQAIQIYDKSLMEDMNPKVKDQLHKLKKQKKQFQAKQYINPEKAEEQCEEGNTLFKNGKFPQALKKYQEAIRRNPQRAKYYSNLGTVYIKLMQFQRARDYFETALKKDPSYAKAYPKKGDCHYFLKEYHKALQTYEAGLKLDPESQLCKQGIQKTQSAIYMSSNETDQEERAKRAMADPEIQAILQTPQIRNALADIQRDPKTIQNVMKDKNIAAKIEKLIAAGILRMG